MGCVMVLVFERLLPNVFYLEDEDGCLFKALRCDGSKLVYDLIAKLCEMEGQTCPFGAGDFRMKEMTGDGMNTFRIDLPQCGDSTGGLLRAYLAYGRDNSACRRYFLVKRFPNGKIFNLHIDPQIQTRRGVELADCIGDLESEYQQLIKDFKKAVQVDSKKPGDESCARQWSRDWASYDWRTIKEELGALSCHKKNKDIGISSVEFLEYIDWLAENMPRQSHRLQLYVSLRDAKANNFQARYVLSRVDEYSKAFGEYIRDWSGKRK